MRHAYELSVVASGVGVLVTLVAGEPALCAGTAAFEDEIELRGAPPIVGVRIVEDTWRRVVATRGIGLINVPSYSVIDVRYGDSPRAFLRGLRWFAHGEYDEAIAEGFGAVLGKLDGVRKVGGRPWGEQYCLFHLGRSHLRRSRTDSGDLARARLFFERLLREVPDTRFLFEAAVGIGEAWHLEGRHTEAREAFTKAAERLTALARRADLVPQMRRHVRRQAETARLRAADMLRAQGRWDDARRAYITLAAMGGRFPAIGLRATVGVARSLLEADVPDQALKVCDAIDTTTISPGEALGAVHMARGDCHFALASRARSSEEWVRARWEYLRITTLHFDEPQLVAKAHYRAGRCYQLLIRQEGAAARRRAVAHFATVVERHPGTKWAEQAARRLKEL